MTAQKELKNKRSRCMRERCCVRGKLARSLSISPTRVLACSRSGQAALEFLMTYGWAILVVLVAIGALAYFGVLSPDKFLPAKCTLQAGIACLDYKATATTVQIVLQNSLGSDISSVVVKAGGCGQDSTTKPTLSNGEKSPAYTITCDSDPITAGNQPLTGSKYNAQLNVSYTLTDSGLSHTNVGQITTRIE